MGHSILYQHPPPPPLRVKEILGGGRGPLAEISEGVAMLVTLIFLFFLKGVCVSTLIFKIRGGPQLLFPRE